MRFEAIAAATIGILLPVLETYRRGVGYWGVEFTTMFEDYVAGALTHRWVGVASGAALGRDIPRAGVGLRHRADEQ